MTNSPTSLAGRLKEIEDRQGNLISVLYEELDPDGTALSGDEKQVPVAVVDTMGREYRFQWYAANAQSANDRTYAVASANTVPVRQSRCATPSPAVGDGRTSGIPMRQLLSPRVCCA